MRGLLFNLDMANNRKARPLVIFLFLTFCTNLYASTEEVAYDIFCTAKIDTKVITVTKFNAINSLSGKLSHPDFMLWGDHDFHEKLESDNTKKALLDKQNEFATEFSKKELELKKLPIGDEKVWLTTRDRALNSLRLRYAEAAAHLEFLLTNKISKLTEPLPGFKLPSRCKRYIDGLENLNALKKFAPIFAEENCATNGDIENCKKNLIFSPNSHNTSLKFRILSLGLSNCSDYNLPKVWTEKEEQALNKLAGDIKCQ